MRGVQGHKEMEIVDINPPIALATFDAPMQGMKFIRGQKRNPTVQTNKVWVSENRSRMERMRCKAGSKLKKISSNLVAFSPPTSSWTIRNFPSWFGKRMAGQKHCEWKRARGFGHFCFRAGIGKTVTKEGWTWQSDICWHRHGSKTREWNESGNHPNEIIQLHVVVKKFAKHRNPNSVWIFYGWSWWRGFRCSSFHRNMAVRARRFFFPRTFLTAARSPQTLRIPLGSEWEPAGLRRVSQPELFAQRRAICFPCLAGAAPEIAERALATAEGGSREIFGLNTCSFQCYFGVRARSYHVEPHYLQNVA